MNIDIFSIIFNLIFKLILGLVKIILIPIDALIALAMPDVTMALSAVADFLTLIAQSLGWALSVAGIPWWVIAFMASFYIFKFSVPPALWVLKLGLKWYKTLKP